METSSHNRHQNVGDRDHAVDQRPTYIFSQEELRVLKECNEESLLFRAIPFGTILGSATYYAIYTGKLRASPQLGYFPKVLGAVFMGYILGNFSYRKTCMEKILQLPNSKLADSIRRDKGITLHTELLGVEGSGSSAGDDVFTKIPQKPIFDDHKPDERDRNEGLDEYRRVTDSLSEYTQPADQSTGAPVLSYDDRRRLNREEYNVRRSDTLRKQLADLSPSQPPSASSPPVYSPSPSTAPPSRGRRNIYGDIVYDE